jgi:hypothetical protein
MMFKSSLLALLAMGTDAAQFDNIKTDSIVGKSLMSKARALNDNNNYY